MYVDWEYYKIFYYVAKYQNFTRAARVLGNNQPNITHAMNRLESQLNCVLFIRSNRGVTLTPEGELLYSRIASAAVQIQDAEEELSATATLEHGAISISTTETALNIYLSEKLRAFHTEYPGIRLRISNHSTPQAVQAVRNGEVDFAIVTTPLQNRLHLRFLLCGQAVILCQQLRVALDDGQRRFQLVGQLNDLFPLPLLHGPLLLQAAGQGVAHGLQRL